MSLDSRRLAEERSLAFHREIASRLEGAPEALARARERVECWKREGTVPARYADDWSQLLQLPLPDLIERMTARTQAAHDLRQVSPFAHVLDARTRWRIHKSIGEQLRNETR